MNLKYFQNQHLNPGFVNSISEIISEMKQYNISYEILETIAGEVDNETLKLKLKDISKIYKAFEEKLHENYVDSQDILNSLAEKIDSVIILKMLIYT